MRKLILFSIFITFCTALDKINTNILNRNVDRTIDLNSQLVKISAIITLENTGPESIRNYLIVFEPDIVGNVSYIGAKDPTKEELKVAKTTVEGHKEKNSYSVYLKQPLASGRLAVIHLEVVLTGALIPSPAIIIQKDRQLVRFYGNHYFYSPYITAKQSTTLAVDPKSIENYTRTKPVTQNEQTMIFGGFPDIKPFEVEPLMVHYENHSPFLTITRLERLIEISHWGNIAVEENIEISHSGAKLKGAFSRYDYQRDTVNNHHSVKSYRTILPASAHSIYYRDSNGNISTSQIRQRKEWTELELRPRFPLFGGWRTSYTLGYSVPSYQYLYRSSPTRYVLTMRIFDHVFDDMFVKELETSIVLPVGVKDIKLKTPYNVQRLPNEITHKYLDNIGRLVIKLEKRNLVEHHIQDFEIQYEWQVMLLLHEPLLLSVALYVMFLAVIIYVRLDFTINKSGSVKKD